MKSPNKRTWALVAGLLVASTLLVAAGPQPGADKPTLKWEYKVQTFTGLAPLMESEPELNDLGREGWELIELETLGDTPLLIFRRQR